MMIYKRFRLFECKTQFPSIRCGMTPHSPARKEKLPACFSAGPRRRSVMMEPAGG